MSLLSASCKIAVEMKKLSIQLFLSLIILMISGLSWVGSSWVASFDNQLNNHSQTYDLIKSTHTQDLACYVESSSSSGDSKKDKLFDVEVSFEEEKEEDKLSTVKKSSERNFILISLFDPVNLAQKLSITAVRLSRGHQSIFSTSFKSLLIAFCVIRI